MWLKKEGEIPPNEINVLVLCKSMSIDRICQMIFRHLGFWDLSIKVSILTVKSLTRRGFIFCKVDFPRQDQGPCCVLAKKTMQHLSENVTALVQHKSFTWTCVLLVLNSPFYCLSLNSTSIRAYHSMFGQRRSYDRIVCS